MYTAQVQWDSLYQVMDQQAEHAETLEDLRPALTTLLNGMKDKHGRIVRRITVPWLHLRIMTIFIIRIHDQGIRISGKRYTIRQMDLKPGWLPQTPSSDLKAF
jgi:hypothetical protein